MELVTHRFPKTKELLLAPIGDIQWGGDPKEVAMGMLKRHVQWVVDRGGYFIGMGDYIDTFSPSNRQRLKAAGLYDTATKAIDSDAKARVRELYELALKPSKGRWIGLLEGHHHHEFKTGDNTDTYLANLLDTVHLGSEAIVRLVFKRQGSKGSHSSGSLLVYATHGQGGGSTAGSALNRIARMASSFDADIFLMGHHHKVGAQPLDFLRTVWQGEPRLVHQTKMLVTTGSFLKSRVVGSRDGQIPRGGYAEQGMMNPLQLGAPILTITPRWKDGGLWVPDIRASV